MKFCTALGVVFVLLIAFLVDAQLPTLPPIGEVDDSTTPAPTAAVSSAVIPPAQPSATPATSTIVVIPPTTVQPSPAVTAAPPTLAPIGGSPAATASASQTNSPQSFQTLPPLPSSPVFASPTPTPTPTPTPIPPTQPPVSTGFRDVENLSPPTTFRPFPFSTPTISIQPSVELQPTETPPQPTETPPPSPEDILNSIPFPSINIFPSGIGSSSTDDSQGRSQQVPGILQDFADSISGDSVNQDVDVSTDILDVVEPQATQEDEEPEQSAEADNQSVEPSEEPEDEDNLEESNADEEFEGQEFQSDRQTPLGTCFVSICDELFEIDFQDIPFLGSA